MWKSTLMIPSSSAYIYAVNFDRRMLNKILFAIHKSVCLSGYYWWFIIVPLTLILRRSRTGTLWFYTSTSNKRAARPKLYTKLLTRDLKRMYSRLTLVRIYINL